MRASLIAWAFIAASAPPAFAEICPKSGEEATGINLTCFYSCTAGESSQIVRLPAKCPATIDTLSRENRRTMLPTAVTRETGCVRVSQRVSGMNKECVYSCKGRRESVTVGSMGVCPTAPR